MRESEFGFQPEQSAEDLLNEKEKNNLAAQVRIGSELDKKRLIFRLAKDKNVSPDVILKELRSYSKEKIKCPEKVKHYHRTSLENFRMIVNDGLFLSRSEIKKRYPERKLPGWSASDSVMMTADKFDDEGRRIKPGLTERTEGASGGGVIFVFGPGVMNVDSYDASGQYPTIDEAGVSSTVEAVLTDNPESITEIENILKVANLEIPVMNKNDWLK